MAAELLSAAGVAVTLYDRMPSVGRKLLIAGRGGLNLTHSEPLDRLVARYGAAHDWMSGFVEDFPPGALAAWAASLGQRTFVGSSGRVFPLERKASPLLRAWLGRIAFQGVNVRTLHEWVGWSHLGDLHFIDGAGCAVFAKPDAAVLALGGASWPRLGSNGAWVGALGGAGVMLAPFRPANMGFRTRWSADFADRFAGAPLKTIAASFGKASVRGEAVVTRDGIEGGVVYALCAPVREAVDRGMPAVLTLDLCPDLPPGRLTSRLTGGRGGDSMANRLRKAGLSPVETALMREVYGARLPLEANELAAAIKAVPLTLVGAQGLDRAISTAGGVMRDAVNDDLSLKVRPDVFVAGEMLDWEAPTGGYLLQACFSTGVAAARGVLARLGVAQSGIDPPGLTGVSSTRVAAETSGRDR